MARLDELRDQLMLPLTDKDGALLRERPAASRARSVVLLAALFATGCEPAAPPDAAAAVVSVVDSVTPREEALRHFRDGLPEAVELEGGAASRDELVGRFVAALEARDTLALQALSLTKSEFAFLYYPTNPQSLPPYDLAPDLMWFMLAQNSAKGLQVALSERGGRPLEVAGHTCQGEPSLEGENRVWGPCTVERLQAPGDTVSERLFGLIVERGGRFKFASYANNL